MHTFCALFVCLFVTWVTLDGCHGFECCTSYTDPFGEYHPSQLCKNYCCWNLPPSNVKVCCDDSMRQVPSTDRDQDSCTTDWIHDHIWVPIVSSLVFVGIIVLCCLCCCGCCACCRRDRTVVMQSAQSSVIVQSTNVMHAGYNQ